jgi:hypothetical protein
MTLASAALFLALATAGGHARAESDDVLRDLRIRFARGQSLENAGRWADALERFEEIARVRSTAQVTFHAALCLDHLGRLLAARDAFRDAVAQAERDAAGVVGEAKAHLADLDQRIPLVTVALAGATDGVELRLDGRRVDHGAPLAMDPGPHLLVAMRDGGNVAAIAFAVGERERPTLRLAVLAPRMVRR